MEYTRLGNSELEVSRICMGGCPMGGYGWGKVIKSDLKKAVHKAIDYGINFFDTADTYGLGESERLLGDAIKNKRDEVIVATKFGVRVINGQTIYDNSPEWINQAVVASLKRLQTDYIDLYQIHYRDNVTPMEAIVETLERLKDKGYIRYYGLSNVYKKDMPELEPFKDYFITFQDEYSLACRENEEDMIYLSEHLELTPMTWGSLGQGILSGKYDKNSVFGPDDRRSSARYVNFHGKKLEKNLEIVEVMRQISKEINKPIPAIAIRWILDFMKNSVVLVGIKNEDQVISNAQAVGWELDPSDIQKLEIISRP